MSLKITILSGGSGNDKLINGLKSIYKSCDIKVITNLYDSGKSTGICRKVTNTLGVSDVRKNHIRMYLANNYNPNKKLVEFYNNRYNLTPNHELEEVLDLLNKWDLSQFNEFAYNFFNRDSAKMFVYNDFSIANIIYSEMYSSLGYMTTNRIFCNLLNIDDFVLCNSFDNVYIEAVTESGNIIEDEGDIVNYANKDDKIKDIRYEGIQNSINPFALDRILASDLIIISTGTFWSSIYPTLQYMDFYKYINTSRAKKIWAINNEEDKDAYGVSSNDFINIVSNLGLNLNDFTILENLDAKKSLQEPNNSYNIIYKHMGNDNGKHSSTLYAQEIFKAYYNLNENYDKFILDFDDTIWSRDAETSSDKKLASRYNITYLNYKLSDKAIIISGNTFESISKKLYDVFGTNLDNFNIELWADTNCRKYDKNKVVDSINTLEINKDIYEILKISLYDKFKLNCIVDNKEQIFNIKIKPLNDLERKLLVTYLNEALLNDSNYIAKITGTSTVDIMHKDNNKLTLFNYLELDKYKTLYIGDEIDSGNDKDIAKVCTNYINVSDVEETSTILKLLGEIYEKS